MENNCSDFDRCGKRKTTKMAIRAGAALVAASVGATWCLFAASNAKSIVDPAKGAAINLPATTPFVDIASTGPLTHIWLGNELSCQVQHVIDGSTHEFFPPSTIPGDCGTFIAMGGALYAPDFTAHGGTATGGLGAYTPFTPVSQTPVTGSGTSADPFKVVTVVAVGATGLSIEQTDTYVVGVESYRTDITIMNNSPGPATGVLFRAGDAYLQGSDVGYGFTEVSGNRNTVGCSVNPNNMPPDRIEGWTPLTDDNNFYEAVYSEIWRWIGTKFPFPNMCGCTTLQDNGAGISWNFSIPAGGTTTYSHLTTFSPTGVLPSPTPLASPTPTPSPSASPTTTPRFQPTPPTLGNISTRSFVQTGGNVMIGGFIVEGTESKRVIIRAVGPELSQYGVPDPLTDPTLELHESSGALIASNDNWQTSIIGGIITHNQVQDIQNSGHAPGDTRESAIIAELSPGNYTAIVRGVNNTIGVALAEVYDIGTGISSKLGNISTRSFIQTSDNVMIGGFIVQGTQPKRVIVRAIGPKLGQYGVPDPLQDPTLELHNANGTLIASNNNWQTTIIGGIIGHDQVSDIQNSGHVPGDARESAIIASLPPGNYTAIVRGVNNTSGVALVEVYDLR